MYSHFRRTTLAAAILLACATSTSAQATDAITIQAWGGGAGTAPAIGIGDSLSVTKNLAKSGYSDNPSLLYSAWAHAGGSPWYTFQLTELADVTISLSPGAGASATYLPAMTVWASGASMFDGGTGLGNNGEEQSNNGWNSPHSFNAVGQIGDNGTLWAASGHGGNMLETLAYAVTGASHTSTGNGETGWDENILTGFHDLSSNTFVNGVTGTATAGSQSLSMVFNDLQAGWYTMFIGGSNHASASSDYILSVAAVPEPETYAMFLAGLGLLGVVTRRRKA